MWRPVAIVALCLGLAGCVAPQSVKDASTQHGQNIAAMQTAVKGHRDRIKAYYQDLIALERSAFVASKAQKEIERTVEDALNDPAIGDDTSRNFIARAVELTDVMRSAESQFDHAFKDQKEDAVALRVGDGDKELERLMNKDDPESAAKAHELLFSVEQDHYLLNAIRLQATADTLDEGLKILSLQLDVMKAAHAIIDDYIATDVTINGAKIGQALVKGAQADPNELSEVTRLIKGGR